MRCHPTNLVTTFLLLAVSTSSADTVAEGQWFHQFLNTKSAHLITTGTGTTVAVIDTGIDALHPDLSRSVSAGTDFVETGDGRADTDGHGTAMAGLISSNGKVRGIAPGSRLAPVRTTEGRVGSVDKLAQGIRWSANNKVDVILISRTTASDDLLLEQETRAALASNIVVVAGAGNVSEINKVGYPAAIPGVVAVGGVDRSGIHSKISVTGPEVVITAPSDDISSTDKGGGYRKGTGTSDAAAIVAGAVALVRAKYPELSGPEVVRRLTATAIDKGPPGRDDEYGYGVLNLVGALTAELPPTATGAAPMPVSPTPTPPRPEPGGFPWWLVAVLPVTAGGIAAWLWLRMRRRGS